MADTVEEKGPEPLNLGGRPRIELGEKDWKQIKAMVNMCCTADEVCAVMDISKSTLDRRIKEEGWKGFDDFYKKNSIAAKAALRRAQYESAINKKNVTMQIWLGKQWLDQVDKKEFSGPDGEALPFTGFVVEILDPKSADG